MKSTLGAPLPRRARKGDAGYDMYLPEDLTIKKGQRPMIDTGIILEEGDIPEGHFAMIVPRSSTGSKYGLALANTVGIIDSDYYFSDNEGHIFIKISNDSYEGKTVTVAAGEAFAQGIFCEYGITVDDNATAVRNGGFGSTTR